LHAHRGGGGEVRTHVCAGSGLHQGQWVRRPDMQTRVLWAHVWEQQVCVEEGATACCMSAATRRVCVVCMQLCGAVTRCSNGWVHRCRLPVHPPPTFWNGRPQVPVDMPPPFAGRRLLPAVPVAVECCRGAPAWGRQLRNAGGLAWNVPLGCWTLAGAAPHLYALHGRTVYDGGSRRGLCQGSPSIGRRGGRCMARCKRGGGGVPGGVGT
jgi:hypothetical protein